LNQRNEEQSQTENAIFDQNWELKLEEMRNAHGDKVILKKKVELIQGQSLAACLNDLPFCALFSSTLFIFRASAFIVQGMTRLSGGALKKRRKSNTIRCAKASTQMLKWTA
jgi:hypothetical protein